MKRIVTVLSLSICLLVFVHPAKAWHDEGHVLATDAAVLSLADELPAFFVDGLGTIRHTVIDPDAIRSRDLPELRATEGPEHYIDYEFVKDYELPTRRYDYYAMCYAHDLDPSRVGTLPYAMVEWTQRLTMAFAEYRKWPDDPVIQSKILVYAGVLAHYAGDAGQPLHTTIHFNGRVDETGKVTRKGIHERVDDLYLWVKLEVKDIADQIQPQQYDQLMPHVMREILTSHALVDRVYELEDHFPAMDHEQKWEATAAIHEFALDRMHHSAHIIASLFLTAWRDSQTLPLPDWLDRQNDKAPSP